MVKKFRDFLSEEISANGFSLKARDAHDAAKNINYIFIKRSSWFSAPKPMHISELCAEYKQLVPDMEIHFPGVVDKILHPDIVTKLGYPVDANGMVHWSR
jgi:hypothetical protein